MNTEPPSSPAAAAIEALAAPHIRALHAYTPGAQPAGDGWIKLNTNELPYPPSPRVAAAIQAECARLALYPNPTAAPLRAAIAARHGLQPAQVIVGNGSDDLLNLLMRVFGDHAGVGQTFPSYSLYPVLAAMTGGRLLSVPFAEDMRLPVAELAALDARILFLTTPNAPTGVGFATAELDRLAAAFPGILVLDEAYADFADENALPLLARHPRVVITRTFSKSHGLAGLRVGYALADPATIDLLDRVRDSYNVNRLSQAGALAALADDDWHRAAIGKVRATRDRFRAALLALGWHTWPAQANFVLTRPRAGAGHAGPEIARALQDWLAQRRILVRYFGSSPLTADCLRISIGTDADMNRLLEEIASWQKQG
jgi:histidinol-phosphate aminotransferase